MECDGSFILSLLSIQQERLVSSKESQLCEATILIPLAEIVDGSPSDSLVSMITLKLSTGDGFA